MLTRRYFLSVEAFIVKIAASIVEWIILFG